MWNDNLNTLRHAFGVPLVSFLTKSGHVLTDDAFGYESPSEAPSSIDALTDEERIDGTAIRAPNELTSLIADSI